MIVRIETADPNSDVSEYFDDIEMNNVESEGIFGSSRDDTIVEVETIDEILECAEFGNFVLHDQGELGGEYDWVLKVYDYYIE